MKIIILSFEQCFNPLLLGKKIYICRCNNGELIENPDLNKYIICIKLASGSTFYPDGMFWGCAAFMFKESGWNLPGISEEDYKEIFERGDIPTNNGRKNCFKCNCKTEERRDFSTFELRLMCPRCKV